MVSANCENESYNPPKGPSTPAFTNRDGCLFDLSIPYKDDIPIITVSDLIRVINVRRKGDKLLNAIDVLIRSGCYE